MSNLKRFLRRHEGMTPNVYDDIKGNPTVGIGSNLNSPEVPGMLQGMGLNADAIRAGEQKLNPQQIDTLANKQIEDKAKILDEIRQRDFPQSDITPNEQDALMSLMYNNPELIGPNMRSHLQKNDDLAAAREIMLHSNKGDIPGIQKRRLEEAEMYAGENFENVIKSLTPEELDEIKNIIGQIKNPHTRMEIMKQFPFLKDVVPSPRFKRLRKP